MKDVKQASEKILNQLQTLEAEGVSQLNGCDLPEALQELKVKYLGKSGLLTQILRGLSELTPEQRPEVGAAANRFKQIFTEKIDVKQRDLTKKSLNQRLALEKIDITLPSVGVPKLGAEHPISKVMEKIITIFHGLGFAVEKGPEIESDYYNFTALNFADNHPARDMQDTFFVEGGWLLRTHTSPVQIRAMQKRQGALRIIAPGAVYRCDADVTHSPMFHQVEGLAIDTNITMADLKGTLHHVAKELFAERTGGKSIGMRFRPSFFPFTEPSAEVDIACVICNQKPFSLGPEGCRVCGSTGWLEILGAGMVHPNVLKNVGYDPEKYQGFAFGMGVERVAMLLYGINDIRLLYENSLPFLEQFA